MEVKFTSINKTKKIISKS